jgi:nucleotide-binding universal stress UspA family protein
MPSDTPSSYAAAVADFRQARRKALLNQMRASLTGESTALLSYEDVRRKLKGQVGAEQGLQEIPLDAIVGSVGRYADFTRTFLPLKDDDAQRWARIKVAATGLKGLPPIEVYQIGDAYFVKDGNHRVSVAHQLGATHIQAYVTPVTTKVSLDPDTTPDDLIIKAEYVDFLEKTHLDEVRPEADLIVTAPGKYAQLLEHIRVHRYFMGLDQQRDIPLGEAVAHWYDTVYLPAVEVIRDAHALAAFPDRTETDLYLWLAEHKAALEETLGWEVEPEIAAKDLADQQSAKTNVLARVSETLWNAMIPEAWASGPSPGQWRAERDVACRSDRLFCGILVALDGQESGWQALDEALVIARWEETQVKGLHVVASEEAVESDAVAAIRAEFERRCTAADVRHAFAVEVGKVGRIIVERAQWVDLVVISLSHPPKGHPLRRFLTYVRNDKFGVWNDRSFDYAQDDKRIAQDDERIAQDDERIAQDHKRIAQDDKANAQDDERIAQDDPAAHKGDLRTLLQRCSRPILAVPRPVFPLQRVLLAYDGSPKAEEALFIATYIAARWPDIALTVMTVASDAIGDETLTHARIYLEDHGVDAANYILAKSGPVATNVLITAETQRVNLIIMGGYSHSAVLEPFFGSAVAAAVVADEVLRTRQCPVLVCR